MFCALPPSSAPPQCLTPSTICATQGLERGEYEAAGSIGVNLTLVHSWTRACLRAGMLSEDGRCKTLDASAGACTLHLWRAAVFHAYVCMELVAASMHVHLLRVAMVPAPCQVCHNLPSDSVDGYVRAEGVGAVMLALANPADPPAKRSDAPPGSEDLAWQALALLAGSSVNQDGRSSSLTAPNGPSQQEAVNAALRSGSLAAWQVAHLQMHGTGEDFRFLTFLDVGRHRQSAQCFDVRLRPAVACRHVPGRPN